MAVEQVNPYPQPDADRDHGGQGFGYGRPERTAGTVARITLLSRASCHLCEYAREAVARVSAGTGVGWTEVDVDDHPELAQEYGDRVPVVLVDGREHDYFRVDEARLRRAVTGGEAG